MRTRLQFFLLAIFTAAISVQCSSDSAELLDPSPDTKSEITGIGPEVTYLELEPTYFGEINDDLLPAHINYFEIKETASKKDAHLNQENLKSSAGGFTFVYGKVVDGCDPEGGFLTGVAVEMKGGGFGDVTDEEGAYIFPTFNEQYTNLVYSFPGYKTREIVINAPICRNGACGIPLPNVILECADPM